MITQGIAKGFPDDVLNGVHQANDEYRLALYTDVATIGPDTVAYTPLGEVPVQDAYGPTTYKPGGVVLTGRKVQAGGMTFAPAQWPKASITARGAMVYNASKENRVLGVFDFGRNLSSTNGDFDIEVPAGVLRIGVVA